MKRVIFSLMAMVAMVSAAYAQNSLSAELAYKVKNEGFAKSKIEEMAQFMTDDMGPRLAASQLKLRAEKMVIEYLKEMGLSNPRAEYAFDFAKGGWDNEMNYVAMTAPYYTSFAGNPKAWSGSTNGLVKGEVVLIEAQSVADLDTDLPDELQPPGNTLYRGGAGGAGTGSPSHFKQPHPLNQPRSLYGFTRVADRNHQYAQAGEARGYHQRWWYVQRSSLTWRTV